MKLICVHKNLKNKVTVTEYPKNYALKEDMGITEASAINDKPEGYKKTKRILLDGVNINFSNYSSEEDRIYEVRTDFPYIQMHFELNGSVFFTPQSPDTENYAIHNSGHALLYFPKVSGQLVYPAGKNIFRIEIEISLAWLNQVFNYDLSPLGKFGEKIKLDRPAIFGGKSFPITKSIRETLMAIYVCNFQPALKKIFIKGKLLELISLQIEQMNEEKSKTMHPTLKKDDIERIHYIKDLLHENMHDPHSINDLANIACMNRTKLQSTFKSLFDNTIYGYLTEERMKKAYQLLSGQDYIKIAEIARQIGYKNPNHFSTAFKNRFGLSPKEVKNLT